MRLYFTGLLQIGAFFTLLACLSGPQLVILKQWNFMDPGFLSGFYVDEFSMGNLGDQYSNTMLPPKNALGTVLGFPITKEIVGSVFGLIDTAVAVFIILTFRWLTSYSEKECLKYTTESVTINSYTVQLSHLPEGMRQL